MTPASGHRLFGIVEAYAALGDHRTGTPVDRATAEWMADQLGRLGLAVRRETVGFDRWVARSRLTCEGADVAHLPLADGWTGSIDTHDVDVGGFDPRSGGHPSVVDAPLAAARARNATAVVLATRHPDGALVAVNRDPAHPSGADLPTVLVAGRDLDHLDRGDVHLTMTAHTEPGTTTNLVADRGVTGATGAPDAPLVLTTPMHGWFGCAGERGTGIAVLLHVAERLLTDRPELPIRVLVTGGHELTYLGAHAYVDAHPEPPAAVVHVGASAAVEETVDDGSRRLARTRIAMTSVDGATAASTAAALAAAELSLATDVEQFTGEGEAFHRWGAPLCSTTGAGVDFHTPDDIPERATSPAALARVADAYLAATLAFVDAVIVREPTAR